MAKKMGSRLLNQFGNGFKMGIILIALAGAIALWFVGKASWEIWEYVSLASEQKTESIQWEIREINASKFLFSASYIYQVEGKKYAGKSLLHSPAYLNRPSAEAELKERQMRAWNVWFDPAHPAHSSLQRSFPLKSSCYALLTLGIFLYFLFYTLSQPMVSRSVSNKI